MVYAIGGIGSFWQQINQQFRTVPLCIPHANVSYMDSLMDSHPHLCHGECAESSYLKGESYEYARTCLDAVMDAVWKDDDHDEFCGGANSYKTTDGKVVFLTQAESYHHRVWHLHIILSWNLSALSNYKKKSNCRKKQN
jgi:hypothetical protein